jgi:hypothetical protein
MNDAHWTCSDHAIEWGLRELFATGPASRLVEGVLVELESPARARSRLAMSSWRVVGAVAAAIVVTFAVVHLRRDPPIVRVAANPAEDGDRSGGVDRVGLDAQWALLLTDLDAPGVFEATPEDTAVAIENSPASIAFLCADSPRAWSHVRSKWTTLDLSTLSTAVRERVLTCAAHEPGTDGEDWLVDAMQQWPDSFTVDALMHFAVTHEVETPNDLLQQRLIAALDADPTDANWVYVGAHLALRGDPTARSLLEASTGSVDPKHGAATSDRRFAAAIGLRMLGDAKAWGQVVEEVRENVEKGTIVGDLETARWLVARASYFAQAIGGTRLSFASMSAPVERHVASASTKPLDADTLRTTADALPR